MPGRSCYVKNVGFTFISHFSTYLPSRFPGGLWEVPINQENKENNYMSRLFIGPVDNKYDLLANSFSKLIGN